VSWLQISLVVTREQAPLVETLLEGLGAVSVTYADAGDTPILEPDPGQTELWPATRVTGLFPGDADPDDLRARASQVLNAEVSGRMRVERLQDREWERVWLEAFHPMRFGRRLWICPSGRRVDRPDAVVVDLEPGLAFGTGTHPTTALCLRWLERADLSGRTVLDYGCGSGVLAIAALRLGAARAVGVDHDPQALTASRENALKNAVADRLALFPPEALPPLEADLAVANILSGPLIALAPRLAALVRPGGAVALSGVLAGQAAEVMSTYRAMFRMSDPVEQDGWVLLSGVRIAEDPAPSASMAPSSDRP
jgi:ribosomal protein L11 methyltransferase